MGCRIPKLPINIRSEQQSRPVLERGTRRPSPNLTRTPETGRSGPGYPSARTAAAGSIRVALQAGIQLAITAAPRRVAAAAA